MMFDMDGTLVDSMGYWDEVCGEYLKEVGLYSEVVFNTLKPMTLPQTAEYFESEFGIKVPVEKMEKQMCRIMLAHYEQDVQAKPGVHEFLQAMKNKGVRMCVVSSSPDLLVETCLKKHDLTKYFDFLLSADAVGKGKTDPDIYLEAARRLGADPKNTLVFEDALPAGLTAIRAGFPTAAIFDENSAEEWDAFCDEADLSFSDWNEALRALG